MNYHFVFVGINNGVNANLHLLSAERDAQDLCKLFNKWGYTQPEHNIRLVGRDATTGRIATLFDEVRRTEDLELLLVHWSGHLVKTPDGKTYYLVASNTKNRTDYAGQMISVGSLLETLASSTARKKVLILDTCYAEGAIELNQILNKVDGTVYALGACGKFKQAIDGDKNGVLTESIITELEREVAIGKGELDLASVLDHAATTMGENKPYVRRHSHGDTTIKIPIMEHTQRKEFEPDEDSLEQALGYAVQAFRDYLNSNVVDGVELIYFLSYDVWDGCLVYDGLVQGSPEQRLLDYIRKTFLNRDRLRSKFEEKTLRGSQDKLGPAGMCFKHALEALDAGQDPLRALRYFGDLDIQKESEYGHYDRLLGLRCCLYIPLIAPTILRDKHPNLRAPLGGVLMAANTKAYGLTPRITPASTQYKEAKTLYYQSINSLPETDMTRLTDIDRQISETLAHYLAEDFEHSGAPEAFEQSEVGSFLKCIGGVYEQRAARRRGLRRTLHPRFSKSTIRELKGQELFQHDAKCSKAIAAISAKVRDRVERRDNYDPVKFAKEFRMHGVGEYLPDETDLGRDQMRVLARNYLIAYVWRDLAVRIRNLRYETSAHQSSTDRVEVRREIEEEIVDSQARKTLKMLIKDGGTIERALLPDSDTAQLRSGKIDELVRSMVDDLLDDMRETKASPVDIYRETLRKLAPVAPYLAGIAEVETLLESPEKEKYLQDLSHAIQVWLLGLRIMKTSIKDECITSIRTYVADMAPKELRLILLKAWERETANDLLFLSWSVIAAMHNVAQPVERFGEWCRALFSRYLGQEAISSPDWKPLVMLNIFDHHRFPAYKNMITGLHESDERDWLDIIFCQEFFKRIHHAVTSSLILMYELDPGSRYQEGNGMWRMLIPSLKAFAEVPKEDGTFSSRTRLWAAAYMAHAVVFSHLPHLREPWMSADRARKNQNEPSPFVDVAAKFKVLFEQFPVSFILGLCDTILSAGTDPAARGMVWQSKSRYPTCCPFYVSGIRADNNTMPATLCIDLTLWRDTVEEESLTWSIQETMNLLSRFKDRIHRPLNEKWRVYEYACFREKQFQWTGEHYQTWSRYTSRADEGSFEETRLSRLVYEVLSMRCKLEQFWENFESRKWTIVFRFMNVKDSGGTYYDCNRNQQDQEFSA